LITTKNEKPQTCYPAGISRKTRNLKFVEYAAITIVTVNDFLKRLGLKLGYDQWS
jgi:hypothetical protein